MAESIDHRPTGGIGQSRKCCTQRIHNHMVVDFLLMSSMNFAIPGCRSPISEPWHARCFYVCNRRSGCLEEEVRYFRERLGRTPALNDLMALRSQYAPSFRFVIAAFAQILHLELYALREGAFDRR